MDTDRVPALDDTVPTRWRGWFTLQALFSTSLAPCVGIANRMGYLVNEENIALDLAFKFYLYHLLAGRPGLTSQSFFPQL